MNSVIKFKDYTDSAISVLDLVNTPEKAERNKTHIYNVAIDAHNLLTKFAAWHPSSDIEGDMLESKMSRETIMRALAQKRRYGEGDYLTPIDEDTYNKQKNAALYQAYMNILDNNEYDNIKQHRSHIDADTLMMRLGYLANMVNKKIGEVSELLGKPDYSHMNSFSMTVEFSMMELYDFLKKESVVSNVDFRQFADSIEHAHINELWENAYKRRKRNMLQCVFKMLAQEYYPKEWLEQCANNLGVDKKRISNPTRSGKKDEFEDKLRDVLRGKKKK